MPSTNTMQLTLAGRSSTTPTHHDDTRITFDKLTDSALSETDPMASLRSSSPSWSWKPADISHALMNMWVSVRSMGICSGGRAFIIDLAKTTYLLDLSWSIRRGLGSVRQAGAAGG